MGRMKVEMKKRNGFTLVELLLTITILSILTIIGMGQFRNAQKKAVDAQRKSDLSSIQRGLEMYYTDNGEFPLTDDLLWGGEFYSEVGGENIIYMKQLPAGDGMTYVSDGTSYALYAVLQMEDPCDTYRVDEEDYCYGVSSPNVTPEDLDD